MSAVNTELMKINNHWLTSADKIDSPNCDTRDDEEDISLIVIHCISLPEGQFNTPYIIVKGGLKEKR
jgi:AmpD protein